MLRDFVAQNCGTAPGVSATVQLGTALAGFRAFLSSGAFTNGAQAFYYLSDNTQAEWGYGTLTAGTPDTITRTVIGNTAGTTARLNFAAATICYNYLPSAQAPYYDPSNLLTLPGSMRVLSGDIVLGNNRQLIGRDSTSNPRPMIQPDATDFTLIYSLGAGVRFVNRANTLEHGRMTDAGNWFFYRDVYYGINSAASPIATTTNGWHIAPNGTAEAYAATGNVLYLGTSSTANAILAFWYGASTVVGTVTTNGSQVFYNSSSDYRLKDLWGLADGSGLTHVPVYLGSWKAHPEIGRQPMILAHELAAYAPEVVRGDKDAVDGNGNAVMQQVDYAALVPRLLAYIQSLERRLVAGGL